MGEHRFCTPEVESSILSLSTWLLDNLGLGDVPGPLRGPLCGLVAELADARDLGSRVSGRVGSTPTEATSWRVARLACLSVLKTVMG